MKSIEMVILHAVSYATMSPLIYECPFPAGYMSF